MLGRNRIFRWILLLLGLIAIIALTGMNVYSLYELRMRMNENNNNKQVRNVEEITYKVRNRLYSPFFKISRLNLEDLDDYLSNHKTFPDNILSAIQELYDNPIYTSIYYTPEEVDPCNEDAKIYTFNKSTGKMESTSVYSHLLCDGIGLVRTKSRIRLNDFDYQWNNIIEFDTHRTMNVSVVDAQEYKITGYFTFIINKDYVVNDLIKPMLLEHFSSEANNTVVWLHDYRKNEVLTSNNDDIEFNYDIYDSIVRFPRFFDDWNFKIGFFEEPIGYANSTTFVRNIVVLGITVLFLLGALLFMFFNAQRERELAQRQAGFLANVTHELKTPLAVMQAAGENISDGRVTEKERLQKYGVHIYQESIRLRKMIDRLLDVAKYDAGHSLLEAEPCQINFIIAEYLQQAKEFIERKGFDLTFNVEGETPYVKVDSENIETIISNLVENAIKYSKEDKRINIRVYEYKNRVFIEVEDHGVGIKKKELKNIFRKFYRVEDVLIARTKGHGLGLSIVKSLVKLNNGVITVKSEYGKGTTFKISFPILRQEEIARQTKKSGIIP